MGFLTGKRALIVGLLSTRSIAYGIAEAMAREGCELAFTYQNEKLKDRVVKLAAEWNSQLCFPCDVTDDTQIENVFKDLKEHWDGLDIIIHSVAFAPKDQIEGDYLENIDRAGFKMAHDISSYSLGALAKAGYELMQNRNGSILTLTYLGSDRVVPNYNLMGLAKASLECNVRYLANSLGPRGIRVNAISAGPIKTLAAAGIKDFRKMLNFNEQVSPLRENVTIEQVGNAAAFMCSDLASGITGEVLHVDAGFHAIALSDALME